MSGSSVTRALDAPARIETGSVPPHAGALVGAGCARVYRREGERSHATSRRSSRSPSGEDRCVRAVRARRPHGRLLRGMGGNAGQTLYTAQPGTPDPARLDVEGTLRSVSRSGELIVSIPRPGRPAMLGPAPARQRARREMLSRTRPRCRLGPERRGRRRS